MKPDKKQKQEKTKTAGQGSPLPRPTSSELPVEGDLETIEEDLIQKERDLKK